MVHSVLLVHIFKWKFYVIYICICFIVLFQNTTGGDNLNNRAAYTREGRKQLFAVLQSARGSSGDCLFQYVYTIEHNAYTFVNILSGMRNHWLLFLHFTWVTWNVPKQLSNGLFFLSMIGADVLVPCAIWKMLFSVTCFLSSKSGILAFVIGILLLLVFFLPWGSSNPWGCATLNFKP